MAKINVIENLACSLGRRDEEPNIELANKIVTAKDKDAVKRLVELLANKKKDIQNNSIKVIYEIGALQPDLIKDYLSDFLQILKSKNNRLVWGAMTAIDSIASAVPEKIYAALPEIIDAGEKGSVIAKDHVVGILIKLTEHKQLSDDVMPLLTEQLVKAADNQFAMYAERMVPVIEGKDKKQFIGILEERIDELPKDSQKKRVEKILKKLNK